LIINYEQGCFPIAQKYATNFAYDSLIEYKLKSLSELRNENHPSADTYLFVFAFDRKLHFQGL
jgi:hypothetical protein